MADSTTPISHGRIDLTFGAIAVLLAGAVWWLTSDFPELQGGHPGPSLFPRLVSAGLFVCGLLLLLKAWRARTTDSDPAEPSKAPRLRRSLRLVASVALVVLYPVLHGFVGFVIAITLISFGVALLLGARPVPAVATTLLSSLATYWLFTSLLGVQL